MHTNTNLKHYTKGFSLLIIFALCACAVLTFLFAYNFDNKYTWQGPQALNGVLLIDEQVLEDYPVLFLIDGWEYYGGKLLTPEDFKHKPPLPDEYIFIGQYGGFEAGDLSASPHGSASYRLNIALPDKTQTYMLELPEIFSAYIVYINGIETATMGNPEPTAYEPQTGNKTVSITASKKIEILVAVSDFSHIYSGMVYPPTFGKSDNVLALLNARLVFRSLLCAAALVIGVFSMLIGLLSKKNLLAVLYGFLCLFFVGYVCYPITHTLVSNFYPLYAIENFSFCAMFVVVMLLQAKICNINRSNRFFIVFGVFVCVLSLVVQFFTPYANLKALATFSNLVAIYKWTTVCFITFTAIISFSKDVVHSKTLLCAILIFDCALVLDRFLPMHEPILTGWFPELAGFVLVVSIGLVIAEEIVARYKDNAILEERTRSMERLSAMQQTYYPLIQQKIEEAKIARHDLHHHFVMIDGFLNLRQYESLQSYIKQYQDIISLNETICYAKNDVANVLAHHYAQLANKNNINITFHLDIDNEIKITNADLCSIMSNLLENAVEACMRQNSGEKFICFTIGKKNSALAIQMENSSGANIVQKDSAFISSKAKGRKGYGLDSVKIITKRYGGSCAFHYDEITQMFYSHILLL